MWHNVLLLSCLNKATSKEGCCNCSFGQSRIVLASRLADHHGNKYKVIEEACAFLGQVHNHIKVILLKDGYMSAESYNVGKRSKIIVKVIVSAFKFAKKSLIVDHLSGVLRNAALFALSMSALLHLHQIADMDTCQIFNKDTRLIIKLTRLMLTRFMSPKEVLLTV